MVQGGQGIEIPDPTGEYEILWNVDEEEIELQDIAYKLFSKIWVMIVRLWSHYSSQIFHTSPHFHCSQVPTTASPGSQG
jgi:hypothetical protein